MANLEVARTIQEQLGGRMFFMIGGRDLVGDETSLRFKIMRNSSGVTHIRVELKPDDTYTMTFMACRGMKVRTIAEVAGIHAEQLHATIERHTQLATSMPQVRFVG